MKNKATLIYMLLLCISNAATAVTNKNEPIYIEAELYSVPTIKEQADINSQLKAATLEQSTKTIAYVDEEITIKLNTTSINVDKGEQVTLYLTFNETSDSFNLDVKLDEQSISSLKDTPLNNNMNISAPIKGTTKILKIKSQKFNNAQHALANISLPTEKDPAIDMKEKKEDLADAVALCFIAHNAGKRSLPEGDESVKYLRLLAALIGKDKVADKIRVATQNQKSSNSYHRFSRARVLGNKYCSAIDQKLLKILIHEPIDIAGG